jgi:hypothetical protein
MTNSILSGLRLVCVAVLLLAPGLVLAQSGSVGGTISDDEKSLSGTRDVPKANEPDKPAPRARSSNRDDSSDKGDRPSPRRHTVAPAARQQPSSEGLVRMQGVGTVVSDGNCTCKRNCAAGPGNYAQCVSTCEHTYSGCNKGMLR